MMVAGYSHRAAGVASRTPHRTSLRGGSPAGTEDTSCRSLQAAGSAEGRTVGPRLTARDARGQGRGLHGSRPDTPARGSHTRVGPPLRVNKSDSALTPGRG